VRRHHAALLRVAATFVPSFAVAEAEEVVQDTWLGVLRGISAFEGRSSVKTWLFRILVNRARTAGVRERRTVTLGEGPAVDPSRDLACQQAVELVTDYLEDALSHAARRRFETHLAGCPHCTEYLAQMCATIKLTGQLTPPTSARTCKRSSSPCTGAGRTSPAPNNCGPFQRAVPPGHPPGTPGLAISTTGAAQPCPASRRICAAHHMGLVRAGSLDQEEATESAQIACCCRYLWDF
jgi:hypothetical protein